MAYSTNTIRRAEGILGYGISPTAGPRKYTPVDGIIYTDLFEGVPLINGVTAFETAFNCKINALGYYNQIILPLRSSLARRPVQVEVDALWGSCEFDKDIKSLLDWLEANPVSNAMNNAGVRSKQVEDFRTTTGTAEERQQDLNAILKEGYGYYISRPLIVGVGSEQRDASRYF